MLTPHDDYLIHQTPDTLDRVATSDRNFYDRYYFNCHDLTGDTFLVVAMGVYPNLGIMDAFATCVQRNERQFVVRASRELKGDRVQTVVGPIGVEVIEGLRRFHVWCEKNNSGLDFDITFTGSHAPFEEPHFFRRAGSRVVMDYTRLTQTGRWTGRIGLEGADLQVDESGWRGARDHSWGIRPIGDREGASAPARNGSSSFGFFWNWAPLQFDDYTIMYTISENHDGSRWHEAAARIPAYGSELSMETLRVVEHDLTLLSGTRTFERGKVIFEKGNGGKAELLLEPLALLHMAGAGYAYQSDLWRHGQYHGELAVEGEVWDITDAKLVAKLAGQSETLCRAQFDGQVGYGIFEFILLGLYQPYGFNSLTDVAK
jgi:hypothetical protein